MASVKRRAGWLAGIATFAICASLPGALMASSVAAEPTPQVICISPSSSVENPTGSYRTRPRSCNFHERGKPAADAFMVQMRRMHWLHWGATVAVAKGVSLASMVGPSPTKVRLTRPQTACGHTVFTRARFRFPKLPGAGGGGMTLDRRLNPCG